MMTAATNVDSGPVSQGNELRWKVRLYRGEPRKTAAVAGAIVLAMALGTFALRSPLLGLAGALILFGSTMEYFVGAEFTISAEGASSRVAFSLTSMEWKAVKRVVATQKGILLSPIEKAGTLDAFRGVFLRYGAENRTKILEAVGRYLPDHVRLPD